MPSFILLTTENEPRRQESAELTQAGEDASIDAMLVLFGRTVLSDLNLDLIAFLEFKRFDKCRRQTHG